MLNIGYSSEIYHSTMRFHLAAKRTPIIKNLKTYISGKKLEKWNPAKLLPGL